MKKITLSIAFCCTLLFPALAEDLTFTLAQELLQESKYELSAIEFRRFAMETDNDKNEAAAYLYSSYAYLQHDDATTSGEMLDRAEDTDAYTEFQKEHTLLSAEVARLKRDADSAIYFYEDLAGASMPETYRALSRKRAAGIYFSQGDIPSAREELKQSPVDESEALEALDAYESGSDKSPKVGGLLGLIPGAGYWYSGEVANGFRSLILNSLFIYGMVSTAEEEQWGAFAIITFFEITWYSGSIYGGIDAAQRYNQNRFETVLDQIDRDITYHPDPEVVVPLFKLNIHF